MGSFMGGGGMLPAKGGMLVVCRGGLGGILELSSVCIPTRGIAGEFLAPSLPREGGLTSCFALPTALTTGGFTSKEISPGARGKEAVVLAKFVWDVDGESPMDCPCAPGND